MKKVKNCLFFFFIIKNSCKVRFGVLKYVRLNKGDTKVPNIKSAIKRVSVNKKKNAENKMIKSQINTAIKKYKLALAEKDLEKATQLLREAVSVIDSASSKNVIHKNNASRKQARLTKLLETIK